MTVVLEFLAEKEQCVLSSTRDDVPRPAKRHFAVRVCVSHALITELMRPNPARSHRSAERMSAEAILPLSAAQRYTGEVGPTALCLASSGSRPISRPRGAALQADTHSLTGHRSRVPNRTQRQEHTVRTTQRYSSLAHFQIVGLVYDDHTDHRA